MIQGSCAHQIVVVIVSKVGGCLRGRGGCCGCGRGRGVEVPLRRWYVDVTDVEADLLMRTEHVRYHALDRLHQLVEGRAQLGVALPALHHYHVPGKQEWYDEIQKLWLSDPVLLSICHAAFMLFVQIYRKYTFAPTNLGNVQMSTVTAADPWARIHCTWVSSADVLTVGLGNTAAAASGARS